jgi:hypothetical protein
MAASSILSRAQRNDIFQMIGRAKLDPADFEWSTYGGGDELKEVVSHRPTDGLCEFSIWDADGFWVHWWPSRQQSQRYEGSKTWPRAMEYVLDWLTAVTTDHHAPDLWGEVAKEKTISGAAEKAEYEKPFSAAELKLLETSLADIEHYITTTQPLDPARKQEVHRRFG